MLIDASGSLLFGKMFRWGNFPSGDFIVNTQERFMVYA